MTETVLSVEGIDVFYGASQILFGVGLELQRGQTMAATAPARARR